MKRRNFVRNVSLASIATPFTLNGINFKAITKELFGVSKSAGDRVLVLIRLNGGNDGLNTVIPLDQYDNLVIQRQNVLVPQASIHNLNASVGLHPSMTGMKNLFNDGKLSILQNVGYPEQNRSHFRSMDIWSTGMMDINESRGWLGRHFDNEYPNYPMDYPNATNPHPFAISMGFEVSSTCQGLMGNFSQALSDPFASVNLLTSNLVSDGSYFGNHMEYLATLIDQTNQYGDAINTAANAGNTLSTMYDSNNPIAMQMRYIAQMISGGLQTKVYILNINGFDTHDGQIAANGDTTAGIHADLLRTLSDAVAAFQNDLQLLGLENRVAGMTFSEFGRQIASNASKGTDHGDAAPLFLFGSCINAGIIGPNPVIGNQIVNQAGVPMQIDFRDVYASILRDWFEVPTTEIQSLFEHTVTYYSVLSACNVGIDEDSIDKNSAMVFPNPAVSKTTVRFTSQNEWVQINVFDLNGREVETLIDRNVSQGTHTIPLEILDYHAGEYFVKIMKASGQETVKFVKIK
jgi:uncharacterized protein (DUF1501 family)